MVENKIIVQLMCRDLQLPAGARLRAVVEKVREQMQDEPMIKSITEKTGKDHIVYIVNGRIVREPEYDSLELKEGDDVRWVHPYFGG